MVEYKKRDVYYHYDEKITKFLFLSDHIMIPYRQ